MQDIKVGRYDPEQDVGIKPDGTREPLPWGGWVEDEAQTWIIYLDTEGRPVLYWAQRDEIGGVVGDPVRLAA